ncbi:MAG: phage tail protein [Clostridia bacterium]|nr:phage tail protein [Clostridia bacterium]MBQ3077428.1 phage tail protein [Clostridia bacterium]
MSDFSTRPDGTKDPFRTFRFKVKMGGLGYMDIGGTTVGAFSQCSGIKATNHVLRVRTGADGRGVQGIIPTIVEYSNVTLTRGVISSNDFLDWVFSCMPGYAIGPITATRRTIDIIVLDEKGQEGITWTLHGAYPVSYELAGLDASADGVLMESLEFAYAGLSRSGV